MFVHAYILVSTNNFSFSIHLLRLQECLQIIISAMIVQQIRIIFDNLLVYQAAWLGR